MKRNRKTTRKLHIESLERRCLLTGTVAVKVAGHTLILTGDNSDNTAVVSGTGNPGEYLVSDPTGTTNFRFQGTDNASVVVEGITDSIIVDLKNAPHGDAFGLTNAALRGSVIVNTGSGNDTVAIGNGLGLEAIIGTDITLGDVRLAGSIVIDTGKGNDLVDIGFANAGAAPSATILRSRS